MAAVSLNGLTPATHTPFHADGSFNPAAIEQQASHLLANGIGSVFIGGSTGESHSLSLEERRSLTKRWSEVTRGTTLRVVVHVGSNCLSDAKALAEQAQQLGAIAISALSPSYFKPRSLETLVSCAAEIASAAPELPFYFYDIPPMTNVHFSMPDFLTLAKELIPTLRGLKFSNSDLMAYQLCLHADNGRWDIPFGCDEYLLGALALGGKGGVGSTYNFAAPIFHRLITAFERGDLTQARKEQFRGVQLVQVLSAFGYMGAAKALMEMLGVPVGPPRLPNSDLTIAQKADLRRQLEAIEFFEWIRI